MSAVELLAERRANALELHRETDETACALLAWHIAKIDAELDRINGRAAGRP